MDQSLWYTVFLQYYKLSKVVKEVKVNVEQFLWNDDLEGSNLLASKFLDNSCFLHGKHIPDHLIQIQFDTPLCSVLSRGF